jgi:hypothetical protein
VFVHQKGMYVRVKEQGGSLAFVLVKSVREGTKVSKSSSAT